jgi:hypothetical protein
VSGEQTLPTIVLIGGQLTLTDGSEVDSRQSATDEKTAGALLTALTSSAEWWSTVSSIVVPTLDDSEGGFAVILGRRSIFRATFLDGEPRRSVLRKVLRGAVGSVSVMRSGIGESLPTGYRKLARLRSSGGDDMGSVGVRFDDPTPRWCFVVDGSEYYVRLVANHLGPCVLIDTTGELPFLDTWGTLSIEYCAPYARPQMVVVPDTARMRKRIGAYFAGPPKTQEADTRAAPAPYVPGAPRDPADFLRFPVVRAECNISGLLRAGQWEDAAGLEAARMLLLKRFDLKLGLWDLALNPVLRSAVLDPVPGRRAPEEPVQASIEARKRAEREAKKATIRREAAQRAIGEVTAALQQELASLGWSLDNRGCLCLPLTEPVSNWPDEDLSARCKQETLRLPRLGPPEHPSVSLKMQVNKSSVHVLVCHRFSNDLDINDFIEKRCEAFESVAPLPPSTKDRSLVPLWTASTGWGDADVDWSSTAKAIAEHTKRWVELLADFAALCREVRARFERYRHLVPPERRRLDLIADIANEHGGKPALSVAKLILVRKAARMTLQAEQLHAAIVRGEVLDTDLLVRLSWNARRVFSALRERAADHQAPRT